MRALQKKKCRWKLKDICDRAPGAIEPKILHYEMMSSPWKLYSINDSIRLFDTPVFWRWPPYQFKSSEENTRNLFCWKCKNQKKKKWEKVLVLKKIIKKSWIFIRFVSAKLEIWWISFSQLVSVKSWINMQEIEEFERGPSKRVKNWLKIVLFNWTCDFQSFF